MEWGWNGGDGKKIFEFRVTNVGGEKEGEKLKMTPTWLPLMKVGTESNTFEISN